MDTTTAFFNGYINRGKELMVFDWEKAAMIIKEKQPIVVRAGLMNDWECTGGTIYENGEPVNKDDTYTYLASTWAVPEIEVDGEVSSCFKMESETPNWDAKTYWPAEALVILD